MRVGPVLALIFGLSGPAFPADLIGSHTWRPDWHGAGGFSALWLDQAGASFATLSDRGTWVTGQLSRDADGAVDGVRVTARGPLLRSTGERLRGRESDAEAIARVGDTFFIAYEGAHRVMRHADGLQAAPERMPQAPDFEGLQPNSGLEALASGPDGTLFAIPERSGREDRPFPVYRFRQGAWDQPFALRRDGDFLVTGADVFDGRIYLLERDFAIVGFRSRVRSFDLTGGDEQLELQSPLRRHDNLEGIAVWRDASGARRITLVSDDNLRAYQRTEFVDYRLD
ncbi:esterase-like activity of phytase family protein [Jannaschia sp. M317]|uniref:esterase-like activity of phytase family protein n=1 Tax=Jannaschia sp. M317 TaxID=2867011 RepID=UPI0021A7B9E4|nr:esterase-like activity of phytase family protein [Jannaschia sp. M317]UWQ18485.1 esterase-like activity of phytase family protein [Jannaschia sp. M317]